MKKNVVILFFCFFQKQVFAQVHPIAFANKAEFQFVKQNMATNEMLKKSFLDLKVKVDAQLNLPIDVPIPKDPAGGYTHGSESLAHHEIAGGRTAQGFRRTRQRIGS
jgi:hypothetical protein